MVELSEIPWDSIRVFMIMVELVPLIIFSCLNNYLIKSDSLFLLFCLFGSFETTLKVSHINEKYQNKSLELAYINT